MIQGIDPNSTIDYVSKFDLLEPKTVWKLSSLTVRSFYKINALLSDSTKTLEGMCEIIKLGLKGYENFMGRTDNKITDDLLDKIPLPIMSELSNKIVEISRLTEAQIKNS